MNGSFEANGKLGHIAFADEQFAHMHLDFALQDALCDLVQIHGIEYLAKFQERRERRMAAQSISNNGGLKHFSEASVAQTKASEAYGVDAVRRAVQAVRNDPTPCT